MGFPERAWLRDDAPEIRDGEHTASSTVEVGLWPISSSLWCRKSGNKTFVPNFHDPSTNMPRKSTMTLWGSVACLCRPWQGFERGPSQALHGYRQPERPLTLLLFSCSSLCKLLHAISTCLRLSRSWPPPGTGSC